MAEETTGAATPGNRFLQPVGAGETLGVLGWTALVVSIVLLCDPLWPALLWPDAPPPAPAFVALVGWGRLALGLTGLAALAVRRRLRWRLPLRRGDALALLLALVAALLLVEAGLRLRGARQWGSALRTPPRLDAMQRSATFLLRPGVYMAAVSSDFDPAYARNVRFTINRAGLRGRLPVLPKPNASTRLVCLGGSTTFGYSVDDGEDWPARLEALLGEGYEVLNAGRPGSTTFRDFPYLRDQLLAMQPDAVVIYEGFNDLWRGVRRHAGEQADYGIVDEDLPPGASVLDQGAPLAWPLRPSFLAYQVGVKLEPWLESPSSRPREPERGGAPFRFDPRVVAAYEHNLAAIVRLCRRASVLPVVVTFAGSDDSRLPADEKRARLRYVLRNMRALDEATAEQGLALYRETTRAVARSEGAALIDLAALLPADTRFYTDTVHFTPAGERAVAEQLATALLPLLQPEKLAQ